MGRVYVFNFVREEVSLSTNGSNAGNVGAASQEYKPGQLAVDRVLNRNEAPGHFYNGDNQITLGWSSGFYHCSVRINGPEFPLNQNLLLMLTVNKWFLCDQFGNTRASGDVNMM